LCAVAQQCGDITPGRLCGPDSRCTPRRSIRPSDQRSRRQPVIASTTEPLTEEAFLARALVLEMASGEPPTRSPPAGRAGSRATEPRTSKMPWLRLRFDGFGLES